jgi:putative inorganic carbon (hco3(-)) transporter
VKSEKSKIKNPKPKVQNKDIIIIALICLLYLFIGYKAVKYEYFNYAYIPLIILLVLFFVMRFYYTVFLVALLVPFSLFTPMDSFSITLPTEPILIAITLVFLWEMFFNKGYEKRYIKHPISMMILINLSWMVVSMIFSFDFLVSLKSIVSRLWFVLPCYFMMLMVFKDIKKMQLFVGAYGISLSVIIIISSVKYILTGFNHDFADYIMCPFYNDHTAYGAVIALFIPITTYYLFAKKSEYVCGNIWCRLLFGFIEICLLVGLVLSYARAAWISVFASIIIFFLIKIRLKLKTFLTITGFVLVIVAVSWTSIIQKLQMNEQASSGNITEHISSISNISTDDSNTERINRWFSAFRMVKERPITGWGCGVYQFVYAAFQHSSQQTPISTNEGTLGNAHSEYIGPLAEQGYMGCLIVIVMFSTTIYIGIRTFHKAKDKNIRNLSLFITLSLITYYIHGFMNDFLDSDKLSVPFWTMTAMIAALDIYSQKKEKEEKNKEIIQ